MTTHKLETAVYAQGWLGGIIETIVARMPDKESAAQITEMWAVIDTTLDELIAENKQLQQQLSSIANLVGDRFVITQK